MAAPRYRQSFAAMAQQAQDALVLAVADLGESALKYAFNKRHAGRRSPAKFFLGHDVTEHPMWQWKERREKGDYWHTRSGNLHDSFGSAVYVNGVLQKGSIRYVDNETWSNKSDSKWGKGREVLNDYLNRIHPTSKKNEVVLICVAAMPYTKFLENGTHAGGYRIHVISEAADYVRDNWEKAVDGIYAKLKIKRPTSRVIKGDVRGIHDYYGWD
jgi:hypothetical protein